MRGPKVQVINNNSQKAKFVDVELEEEDEGGWGKNDDEEKPRNTGRTNRIA